jgi:hypothetical protein
VRRAPTAARHEEWRYCDIARKIEQEGWRRRMGKHRTAHVSDPRMPRARASHPPPKKTQVKVQGPEAQDNDPSGHCGSSFKTRPKFFRSKV